MIYESGKRNTANGLIRYLEKIGQEGYVDEWKIKGVIANRCEVIEPVKSDRVYC